VVWEAADVIFFALTKLAARGLTLAQVEKELRGRHGRRLTKDRMCAFSNDICCEPFWCRSR